MNKFPKLVSRKWKRYNKVEKIFIIYLLALLILEFVLPYLRIEGTKYAFINSKFIYTSIIVVSINIFMLLWNTSYTVKGLFKKIFSLYENEALINFGGLFIQIVLFINTKDLISLLAFTQSKSFYKLDWGFFVLAILIIIGMIWNMFLALNNSINFKNKRNYNKIISMGDTNKSENTEIKSLFND